MFSIELASRSLTVFGTPEFIGDDRTGGRFPYNYLYAVLNIEFHYGWLVYSNMLVQ
jgi:hypothetical protein